MNPCPCGFYPDLNRCKCTLPNIGRYLGRISGPILDRIDLCAEVSRVQIDELMEEKKAESSAEIRLRVLKARKIEEERYDGTDFKFNADLDAKGVEKYCVLKEAQKKYMEQIFNALHLSARAYHRTLKTARTIADLAGSPYIEEEHLMEAVAYRVADRKYWKVEEGKD